MRATLVTADGIYDVRVCQDDSCEEQHHLVDTLGSCWRVHPWDVPADGVVWA